jgi:hypothetical protein
VHPFWSSHEEKRACVRLSMGGGHGQSWSFYGELNGEGEGGGGEGGTARALGARPGCSFVRSASVRSYYCCLREEENSRQEGEEKKEEEKEKRENFVNMEISGKIK